MQTRRSPSANIARQQRFWTRRASEWDHGAGDNPGLVKVVETVIQESGAHAGMRAVDLGCGSGQLTLRLAPTVSSVLGVDVSQRMIDLLRTNAEAAGAQNVEGQATPIEHLDVAPGTVDVVVSNYALHHLHDEDKERAVQRAATWLKPGGRLVVGDMMFGRGGEARDREIIASKVRGMIRRGPAGWWRIGKNAARYLFRYGERPISMSAWVKLFEGAGLVDVRAVPVVNEAAVVVGVKPADAA